MTEPVDFRPLFFPESIAVIGASSTQDKGGNRFIRNLKSFGYLGRIIPIHPGAAEIEGIAASKSISQVNATVDYAYVAVAAAQVPELLRSMKSHVRIAQVMSSGFNEVVGGQALADELLAAARDAGIRVIGPNCLGVYSPRGGVTFIENCIRDGGSVGIICQSGGLGVNIIRRGLSRGVRFSGVVTVGNCLDVQPHELVEHFLSCPDTKVIGLYLEGASDGRQLFNVLRRSALSKPVVILKGGITPQGERAAQSHTGALSSGEDGWKALAKQTGAILVNSLNDFVNTLLVLQSFAPAMPACQRVALFGNGGGASVLGTDALSRNGLDIVPFSERVTAAMRQLELGAGSSIINPIDIPAGALQNDSGAILSRTMDILADSGEVDVLIVHINVAVALSFHRVNILGDILSAIAMRANSGPMRIFLVLRSDGDLRSEQVKLEMRTEAARFCIPVFDEIDAAATALGSLSYQTAVRHEYGA